MNHTEIIGVPYCRFRSCSKARIRERQEDIYIRHDFTSILSPSIARDDQIWTNSGY